MKKGPILLTIVILQLTAYGQTLEIFDVKLKARQITGLKKFGSGKSGEKEILTTNWLVKNLDDFTEVIGGYTDNRHDHTPRDLFNMSTFKGKYEFLDEIDMDYYASKGFDKMKRKNPAIASEALFKKFYKAFTAAGTAAEKKDVILRNEFDKYRWLLLDTRLEFSPKSSFTLKQKQQKGYTLKLKTDIKAEVKNIDSSVALEIDSYIDNLVDKAIELKGSFRSVSFDNSYVTFLCDYIEGATQSELKQDMFVRNLGKYFKTEEARLITEIGVLIIEGDYDASRIEDTNISAHLTSHFNIPRAQAMKVASAISMTIREKESVNFNSKFCGAFIISFLTDKSLSQTNYNNFKKDALALLTLEPTF